MPDATITSTASTFGTISGTFAADQSTITGTITGVVSGTLTGSVGVPGPQGPAGPGSTWGGIVGDIEDQADLWTELGTKYLASNPAGYQTAAQVSTALAPYITSATATASFYPLTGNPSAFLQAAALSPYLLSSTASATYQTQAAMSAYLTTSAAAAGYYPLSGNPSGFLTAASLSGYATESWVTGQGYITSAALSPYLLSSTAASTYQTQSAMSAYLTKADNLASVASTSAARSNLGLGSLDTPTFAGITAQGSGANVANLTPTSLSLNHATSGSFTIQPSVGIVFPDGSTQTTAFTGSAPGYITSVSSPLSVSAGNLSIDLSPYALLSGATFTGSVFAPTPSPGTNSTRIATTEWVKDLDYAPLNSPQFNGNPRGPTPSLSDNDTSLATTEFVKGQNYITSSALSGYATESWVTSQGYLTSAALTGYATESWVTAGFYPLTGNPSGFITSAALSPYLLSSTAASTYAALAGATFSGVVSFDGSTGTAAKSIGDFKSYLNGYESTDYSLQYNNGFQVVQSGSTIARLSSSGLLLPSGGITFSDASVQTSAGISAATADASYYPLTGNPSSFLVAADIAGKANSDNAALTGNVTITTNSTSPALFITQTGTGNILTLHDQSSDTTFVAIDQNGKVNTIASTTTNAGFNVPHATAAPSAPVNGDIWTTTSGLFMRQNGTTQQYVDLAGSQTINGVKTFSAASLTFGNATTAGTINVGTGAIASGTKTVNIGSAGTTGSTTNINIGTNSGGTSTTTVNALLVTRASATTGAGLRIMPGTAPSSPVNGDVWTDTAGIYARINGATVTMSAPSAATVAEAKLGNDTAKFINCNVLQKVVNSPSYYKFPRGIMSTSTSGTGAAVTAGALVSNLVGTTTGAGGALHRYYGFSGVDIVNGTGYTVNTTTYGINFGKQMRVTGSTRVAIGTNSIVRVSFGKNANQGVGDPNQRAIGWRYNQATGFIEIVAHNGTSLVTLTTASNPVASGWFEWELYSNGAGSVQMFVNDVSIGTLTGGPTTFDYGSAPTYVEEVECTATPSAQPNALFRNGGVFLQP
jgi:hypothetical protein